MDSREFIKKFRKKLESGPAFFNPDTSLMSVEKFEQSKCKILVVFPTPLSVKTVSSTAAALNDFVIEHCPDTFIDFAYMPEGTDIKLYDEYNMPYAIGNITHLDASHFDIIGFSISVLSEIVTAPVMMKSFERCDKPISLFWSDRKDLKIGEQPIIYTGGITAACGDVMFGKVGDKQSYIDFQYLGSCDKTDILVKRFIEAKETGKVTRTQEDHEVPGYELNLIPEFESEVKVETIQDYIESLFDLDMVYQPQAYEVKYNKYNQIISNKKINSKARDFVRPYYPHILPDDLGIGRAIINANGDNTGTTQTQVAEGCSAAGACSFCAEGNYCGGWVEKTRERILHEIVEAKKYSAGYKYKPYSFNTNYVTDYKGMLYEFMQKYPKVTFINMRLEELGRDTDALKMMKLIGSNRISAPIEGISPRIQNNLLNKCLSEEALMNFMNDMVHLKMTDIKVGGIFTGYEEDEDFQWICDFVDRFKGRASEEGGNFPFRLKVTPLVHYPLTPCEYLERKSARKSFEGEHWLTDEWYEKFREHQVFFKVNGFRYSTFLEQSFVDMGRELTPLIHKHFVDNCAPVYSLRSVATDEFVSDLKLKVNPLYGRTNLSEEEQKEYDKYMDCYFGDREPEHYISPSHRIHIELMGSYIPRARRLVRAKKSGNIFANEPDNRCLKTYEGAKVKCYSNCIASDPLKIYYDVEMDEGGKLFGDYRMLNGCERCQTPAQRKDRVARDTPQTKNSDDIVACPRIPQVQKIRFVLKRDSEYDLLNPNNTAHTFVTKFLQESDILLDAFHSIANHNMFWQADPQFKYFCSGLQIVDTVWSKNVISEVQRLLPIVNEKLISTKILSAQDILRDEKIQITDTNVFYFETSLPMELLDSAKVNYKGEIKVDGGMQTFALTTVQDKNLKAPVFAQKGKVCGFFTLPAKYNPLAYMSGFISTSKKMGLDAIAQNFTFDCVMTMRDTRAVCKNCGKETSLVSLITGKAMPFGQECLCKALLTQKLKS